MLRFCHRLLLLPLLLGLAFVALPGGRAQTLEPITILAPGWHSEVTGPIEISAQVDPGEDGLIRVTLVDAHQNLLARQLLRLEATSDGQVVFTTQLAFELPRESTTALMTIATQDDYHRPLALRSVMLNLQSSGNERIQTQAVTGPWLEVVQPLPGALIAESPLVLEGTVIPLNEKPIVIELLTEQGGAILTKQLAVEKPGEPMLFAVSLAYVPPGRMRNMRLVIRQPAEIIGENAILDSLPITLAP
jgi:hypothetical protein